MNKFISFKLLAVLLLCIIPLVGFNCPKWTILIPISYFAFVFVVKSYDAIKQLFFDK